MVRSVSRHVQRYTARTGASAPPRSSAELHEAPGAAEPEGGRGAVSALRCLEDPRFVVPVVVPVETEGVGREDLVGAVVYVECVEQGQRIGYTSGRP